MTVVVELHLSNIRQQSIIPTSRRLPTTSLPHYLTIQPQLWQPVIRHPANMTIRLKPLMSQLDSTQQIPDIDQQILYRSEAFCVEYQITYRSL